MRLLVSAGAASAIAAAFNAPVAGVFFALEVILGEFTTGSVSVVVLAAVISSATTQAIGSVHHVFGTFNYTLGEITEIPFYIILGILLALVSSVAIRIFHWQHEVWHQSIKLPQPIETAITGAFVGLVALVFPQILGGGEEFMNDVVAGDLTMTIGLLIGLATAKLLMTAISLGGGFVGGVFAPTLFIGILVGSAYGQLINSVFPVNFMGNPQAYAIAGMAGLLAGIVRAPITAILLVFELTNDYKLILPIMLTSVICTYLADRVGPPGIYTLSLIKNGIHLRQGRDIDVMQGVTVGEAMVSPAPVISEDANLEDLRDQLNRAHRRALCVVGKDGHLRGVVSLSDLQRAYTTASEDETLDVETLTIKDIHINDPITIYPTDVLWQAIRVMGVHDIGHLPVVKDGSNELVGMIRRHDIMDAYNMVIAKKFREQETAEKVRLNTLTGAHVMEFDVRKRSPAQGMMIRELALPPDTVIASIQRRNKLIVPRGGTVLLEHDAVTVVAKPENANAIKQLFGD